MANSFISIWETPNFSRFTSASFNVGLTGGVGVSDMMMLSKTLPIRLVVGHQTLDLGARVRILHRQPLKLGNPDFSPEFAQQIGGPFV